MYTWTKHCALTIALAAALSFSSSAIAKNNGHKGKGKNHQERHYEYDHNDDDVNIDISIHSSDRAVLRHYIADDYRASCPPGLAKKRNGCLPPGQAKKRYRIGRPLPENIVYYPVPDYILEDLRPLPYGYQYVRVDRDVLLISEASHKVIDAITLLSAVGN